MNIFSPVTTLQGIGPTRAKQLEKLEFHGGSRQIWKERGYVNS